MFVGVSRDDPAFRRAITTLIPNFTLAPTLLVLAAFSHGAVRGALWTLALTVDFGGPLLGGSAGWRLSPAHFAERHGLIVIIALGETSWLPARPKVSDVGVPWRLALAGVCAVTVAGTIWWLYFDVVAIAAERRLQELRGRQRNNLARDSYSYLHLPIVASIVLVALAGKKVASAPLRELATIPTVSLGVGSALYLVSLLRLRWRNYGSPNVPRLVAAPIIGMTAAVTSYSVSGLAGIATLAVLLVIFVIFVTFEAVRLREQRHQIRYHEAPPPDRSYRTML
jgi:low temperature requirement protein LtrA